jgi:hypothetical protein
MAVAANADIRLHNLTFRAADMYEIAEMRGVSRFFGISSALADEFKLPDEQKRLPHGDERQDQSEYAGRTPSVRSPKGFLYLLLAILGFGYGGAAVMGYIMRRNNQKRRIQKNYERQQRKLP